MNWLSLYLWIAISAVLLVGCTSSEEVESALVPNEKTAEKIAEAILEAKYGEEVLKQRPFQVRKDRNRWIIDGSRPAGAGPAYKGGRVHIEILESNAQVVEVSHSM